MHKVAIGECIGEWKYSVKYNHLEYMEGCLNGLFISANQFYNDCVLVYNNVQIKFPTAIVAIITIFFTSLVYLCTYNT